MDLSISMGGQVVERSTGARCEVATANIDPGHDAVSSSGRLLQVERIVSVPSRTTSLARRRVVHLGLHGAGETA